MVIFRSHKWSTSKNVWETLLLGIFMRATQTTEFLYRGRKGRELCVVAISLYPIGMGAFSLPSPHPWWRRCCISVLSKIL
jgi:hypothetical protein